MTRGVIRGFILAATMSAATLAADTNEDILGTTESWTKDGEAAIAERLAYKINKKRAKNVILFVGDGMGISTLTAARILEGQLRGESGEENYLSFEEFPNTALVKTYNVDSQVADSAGTASALNTGTKTRIGVINTPPTQMQGQCTADTETAVTPLAYYAEKIGMGTGIVSTARLTHATPAAVYAHAPLRDWEADSDVPAEAKAAGCRDIAQQILDPMMGDGLEVALGGGRRNFQPTGTGKGKREDGRDITKEWMEKGKGAAYVETTDELKAVDLTTTSKLLGLFDNSHMQFSAGHSAEQPDLSVMTETAINMLSQNKKGYYLMVEGGRIDHGHHAGSAYNALNDAVALSAAVKKAVEMVDLDETLILVTADHSHVFTMAGYAKRGNPILGLVVEAHSDTPALAGDGKPYTTLGYHNGPGAVPGERPALTQEEVLAPTHLQQSLIPRNSETHGGEDVGLFAIGPRSYLVRGTMEQNVVFHIMDHALDLRKRAGVK
ncbi:alkaline phosphatase [Kordiimonas aestuarii]|uniref:alkaline phosphatase n=1 Tax=Kordiimonas aestuarii TaxID=1005925 RepID=UPI00374DF8A4